MNCLKKGRNDSLVAKIISRDVLPQCHLVITSRPSASLSLRHKADCRVEVLGFTEEDRLDYIQHALEGSNYKIKALKLYLQTNSTINALCYVPLNMTILLCLFEEVKDIPDNILTLDHTEELGLPNTQTEMYEKFILMTITRFIKKEGKLSTGKCMKISELPKPYNEAFNELSCLAYNALAKDEIVFNLKDSVVQACPILKSGNWEGLGLLKVIEYTNNVSFHFLHFSIQEYLAAYHISLQSENFQMQLLKDTFWNIHYFNTWIMYVGITGGKQFAWKHFISGNWFTFSTKVFRSSKISRKYLNDKIKSLHLFQCYAEIGSKELVKVFKDKIIDLSNQTLLPKDINTICFFLLRSIDKHWIKLDLSSCNIGDTGSDILCKTFLDKNRDILNIDRVDLCDNQLKINSILGLLGVFKAWHTSEAVLSGSYDNASNLFELCVEKFISSNDEKDFTQSVLIGSFLFAFNSNVYNLLENSATITGLFLNNCSYPHIYNYKLTLSKLHIISENMDSYLIGTIVQSINEVDGVYIYNHTLSDEDVKYISLMLHKVHLSSLGVWMVIGGTKILGNLPDIPTLNKQLSPLETLNLAESIKVLCSDSRASLTKFSKCGLSESKSPCAYFFHLLHKYISKCEINFCLAEKNILISNGVGYDKISNALSSNNNLTAIFIKKCKLNETELKEFINTVSKQESLEKFCIFDSSLKMHNFSYEKFLNQTLKLKELFIHNSDSSYPLCFDLLNARRNYPNISLLLIANDTLVGLNPSSEQLLLSLQLETNFTTCKLWNFPVDIELCQQMTNSFSKVEELHILGYNLGGCELLQCNQEKHSCYKRNKQPVHAVAQFLSFFTKLRKLSLCYSSLPEANSGNIFRNLTIYLTSLNISHNEINEQVVNDIVKFLHRIHKLEELNLSCNNIDINRIIRLLNEKKTISCLKKLNISNNEFSSATTDLAAFLSSNTQLKELDLSWNNLQAAGAIAICKAMFNLCMLTKLNLSNNNITGEGGDDIAVLLLRNTSLQELDLNYNMLGASGSLHIISNMKKFSDLTKLKLCNIGITSIAADAIVTVLNNNNELKELDLSHNNIQGKGATIIFMKASAKNLHKFNISHNNINNELDYVENFLSRNANLEELDLSHNNLKAAGIIKVCKSNLLHLTKIYINHNKVTIDAADDIAYFLSQNPKLQVLDLSGNYLQDLGFKSILKNYQIIFNLCVLKISHSSAINKVADQLGTFLLHSTSLRDLDLSYNNLSTSDAVKIYNGIKNIKSLIAINLSHNTITDNGAHELSWFLLNNNSLQEIDLSYNNLSTSDAVEVFNGMKNFSNLRIINISHNTISDGAADNIADILSHNDQLESFDLCYNYFNSGSFIIIFGYLKNILNLKKFNISFNQINVTATSSIATFLSYNLELEELHLNNCMQTASIIIIFKKLRHISSLKKVFINGNMITDIAADDIAAVLSQNTELEELDISCNSFQAAGIMKIMQGIKHISALTKLDIAHNMVGDEAIEYIVGDLSCNCRLRKLSLSHVNLKSAIGFKYLDIRSLNVFDCSNNNISEQSTNEILSFLSLCDNLQKLDLSNINLQSTSIDMLNELNIFNLTKFSISGNGVTVHAANNIAVLLSKNNKLEELDLSCNNLQELGIRNILKSIFISTLYCLNISNCIINDSKNISEILAHATSLVELDMSYNRLSADDMKDLFYKMKHIIANLIRLNVSGNIINDEGATALADALLENTKLEELCLSDNSLHVESINKIFSRLQISTLIKVIISHNEITDEAADVIANFLSRNTRLQELDLSHNDLQAAGVVSICQVNLSKLTNFSLSHNSITSDAANQIAAFLSCNANLKVLDLSSTELQKVDCKDIFKALQNISTISSLNVSNCNVGNEAADELATVLFHNLKLEMIDLSYNNLSPLDIATILRGMENISNLASISVSQNKINDEAADDLATILLHNPNLKHLDLSGNSLSALAFVKIFKGMKNISNLITMNISYNMITNEAANELANVLHHNTTLQKLNMSGNNLSKSDTVKVFKEMKNITSIETICIGYNDINDEAADGLANVVLNNNSLQELVLRSNSLSSSDATKIFKGMKNISNLAIIHINYSALTKKAAEELARVLLHNTLLHEINLSYNKISTLDGIMIFEAMKNMTNLVAIDISHNMISDKAAGSIATVLSHNNKLSSLNLSSNHFRSDGFVKIFNGMKKIVSLRKLSIGNNEIIGFKAVECIANFIFHNSELEELDLSSNFMRSSSIIHIFKSMESILNLKKLFIHGNIITKEAADIIAVVLSQNTKLKVLDISDNNIETVSVIEIFKSIKHTVNFKRLDDNYLNMFSGEEAEYMDISCIMEGLSIKSKLKELNLRYNNIVISDFTQCSFTDLQVVDMSYTNLQTVLSTEGLNAFKIKKYNISGNGITANKVDGIAAFLSENDELQELDMSCNNLQGPGTRCILDFLNVANLTKLNISNNSITSDVNIIGDVLSYAINLLHLDVSYNNLSSDNIECFLHKIKKIVINLIKLILSGNEVCNGASTTLVDVLCENTDLKELGLNDANLYTKEIKKIFGELRLSNLTKLSIARNYITDEAASTVAVFLSKNTKLEELDLSHSSLTSAGAIKICKINLTKLTAFRINHNNITSEAANYIAAFLSHTSDLQVLNLSCNDFQEPDCKNFVMVIKHMPVLSTLKISNSSIINEAADELGLILLHNSSLQVIDLSYNNLSTTDAVKIFKGMRNISNLATINISHNMISDEAADDIATVLSHNNKLQSLDVSHNCLKSKGFAIIFRCLRNVKYLRKLNISYNEITGKATSSIATVLSHNPKLEELNISNTFMEAEGMGIIIKSLIHMSNLKKLHIHDNVISDEAADDIAVILSHSTSLENLDIRCNNLQAANAINILESIEPTSIKKLNIAHNMITDTHNLADVLSKFSKLINLNLSGNDLKSVKFLDALNLTKFNCSHTNIDKKMAAGIARLLSYCHNLQILDLSYANLQRTGGINKLCKLKICSLKKINISGNLISTRTASKLAVLLSSNHKMEKIDLSCNDLQESGIKKVLKSICISSLTDLNISNNNIAADLEDIAIILDNATKLVELDFSCNMLRADSMDCLLYTSNAIYTTLTKFIIFANRINDGSNAKAIAYALKNNIRLQELDLSDNDLHAEGISKIFNNLEVSTLAKFNFSHNNITDEAADDIAAFLCRNNKLKVLDLSHNNLHTGGAIKIFRTNLSNVTTFNISHNRITDEAADDIAAFMSYNTILQVLDLSYNDIQELDFWNRLKVLQHISVLFLLNNTVINEVADELPTFLLPNTLLQEINLSYINLSPSNTIKIFEGMKNMSNLITVNISHNMINNEAAEIIATVLSHNNKLQSLDLSCNHLSSEGFVKIFECLKSIHYLRKLNVSCNQINFTAASSIAAVLSHNRKLEELDLGNSYMQTASIIIIFKSLRYASNLKKVCINNNMITDKAEYYIAVVLSHNLKLEELDISCNYLQAASIIRIFHSIKHISALTKLNIAHNIVGDKAMEYILDALSCSDRLKEINLSHVNVKNAVTFNKLKVKNLKKFNCSNNNISEQSVNEILAFLSCCINLQDLDLSNTNLQSTGGVNKLNELSIFNLTKFRISGNGVTVHAADNIAVLLSKNDELGELDLSCNNLQELGIRNILDSINILNLCSLNISNNYITNDVKHISEILTHAVNLVELDISYNKLSVVHIKHLFYKTKHIFANLIRLNVSGNIINNEGATALADALSQNTKLEELNLSNDSLQAEDISKILNGLHISTLIKLVISHNDITNEAADDIANFLSRNGKLQELNLSNNDLKAPGTITICKTYLSNLTSFNISYNNVTGEAADDIAAFLSHNTKLRILDIGCSDLQELGYRKIFKVLHNFSILTSLKIGNCSGINETADGLAAVLFNNPDLREIDLNYNNLSASDAVTIFEAMKNVTKLEVININNNMGTDDAANSIAAVLSHNDNLQILSMTSNHLTSEGCIDIFNRMKNIIFLRKFDISHNKISFEAADNIAIVLSQNTQLEELDISYNNLQTPGATTILQGIKHTLTLIKLNIAHNAITDEATECIISILCNNSNLKELNLSHNSLLEREVIRTITVSETIVAKFNDFSEKTTANKLPLIITNLQELDLSNINLHRTNAVDIFKEVDGISTLQVFNISANSLTPLVVDNLAYFLSKNNELQDLDLSCNDLQESGIVKILDAVNYSSLTKLDISNNYTNLEG